MNGCDSGPHTGKVERAHTVKLYVVLRSRPWTKAEVFEVVMLVTLTPSPPTMLLALTFWRRSTTY